MTCGYQSVKCSRCQVEILEKNLTEHRSQCSAIVVTCKDCKMVYKPNDALERHSDLICLREQFRDLRRESQIEIQQLKEELRQTQSKTP